MTEKQLEEILQCLSGERRLFHYFKDRYALLLLAEAAFPGRVRPFEYANHRQFAEFRIAGELVQHRVHQAHQADHLRLHHRHPALHAPGVATRQVVLDQARHAGDAGQRHACGL